MADDILSDETARAAADDSAGGAIAPAASSGALVFISYARADRPRVTRIAGALTAAGFDVWWDALIDGGTQFAHAIEAKLDVADAVITVWSQASIKSDWVRDEAAHARDRKRLVPISLDGSEPPLGFRQYHAISLAGWKGAPDAPEIATLVRAVDAMAASPDAPVRPAVAAPSRWRPTRRMALAGAGSALAVAVGGGGLLWWRDHAPPAPANALAVLPFANLSGDPSQAYFSDGLSDEVRAALSRVEQLQVVAQTSSNMFRNPADDARAIAARLGVGFLLEGSVRKAGDRLRIAANLINAGSGLSLWTQIFERPLADIFALQTQIANTVAEALAVQVAAQRHEPGGTSDVAAYDAYLRGLALYNADTGEAAYRGALVAFERAIAADPGYARAHAGRAAVLSDIASAFAAPDAVRGLYDDAIAAAQRAVSLAPDLAFAYLALGTAMFSGRLDFRGARAPYEKALALGQGDADILVAFSAYAARAGRAADAQHAVTKAVTLDPLNPRTYRAAGNARFAARDYEGALPLYQHAIDLAPKLGFVRAQIGFAQLRLGRGPEARAAFLAEPVEMFSLTGLAIADHKLGSEAAAQAAMKKLVSTYGDNAVYQQSQVLAQWGKTAEAFASLDRAFVVGDSGLVYLGTDPMMDPLRGDPRFSPLLRQLGFGQANS